VPARQALVLANSLQGRGSISYAACAAGRFALHRLSLASASDAKPESFSDSTYDRESRVSALSASTHRSLMLPNDLRIAHTSSALLFDSFAG